MRLALQLRGCGAIPKRSGSSTVHSQSSRATGACFRSEEHTSELQSHSDLVCLHSFPTRRSSDLIGSVYRRLGKWQMALDEFYRAAALDPRDPSVIDEAGTTAAGMRRYSEALRLFDRSLAIQPSYWSVL